MQDGEAKEELRALDKRGERIVIEAATRNPRRGLVRATHEKAQA